MILQKQKNQQDMVKTDMSIIETERLILRTWNETDIDAMASIDQDPKVREFLPAIDLQKMIFV